MRYLVILLLFSSSCFAEVIDTSTGKNKSVRVTLTFMVDRHDNEIITNDTSNVPKEIDLTEKYRRLYDL